MKATLAFTALLPNGAGRIAFYSEQKAILNPQSIQLFNTFCYAWKKKYHQPLVDNFRAFFQWEDIHDIPYPRLSVFIEETKDNQAKFSYVTEDGKKENIEAEHNDTASVFAYVFSAHHDAQLAEKKKIIYQHVNPGKPLPEVSDKSEKTYSLIHEPTLSCVDKVRASIEADMLYPLAMKSFAAEHKAALLRAQDDEECQEMKAALLNELLTKKPGYENIQEFLEESFFPCMKQSALVFLFLDHMIEFLPTDETEQLYLIIEPWMDQYKKKHLSDLSDETKQLTKQYCHIISEEKDKHVNLYVAQMGREMRPWMDICGVINGSDSPTSYIQWQKNGDLTAIFVDNGYHLNFNSNDLFETIREDKAAKAISILSKKSIFCDGESLLAFEASKNSYTATINDIDIASEFPALVSIGVLPLSIEEKICLLVSLWIFQSGFNASDSIQSIQEKSKYFNKKVKKFIDHYCLQGKKSYHEREFKEMIAFYVARNVSTESTYVSGEITRLTIEHRKAIVKSIYDNKLPNRNHHANEDDYSVHIQGSANEACLLESDQAYIMEYASLIRPYVQFTDEQTRLSELANYLQVISDSSFMSSNGSVGPGYEWDDPRDQTQSFARLKIRKKAIVALLFQAIVKVSDVNHPKAQEMVQTSFDSLDMMINDPALHRDTSKHSEKNIVTASSTERPKLKPRNVVMNNELKKEGNNLLPLSDTQRSPFPRRMFKTDPEEEKQNAVERSKFTFEKITALIALVETFKTKISPSDTRRDAVITHQMLKDLNDQISTIEKQKGGDYILHESAKPCFIKACNDFMKKIYKLIEDIPLSLDNETKRRVFYFMKQENDIFVKLNQLKNAIKDEGFNNSILVSNLMDEMSKICAQSESYYQGVLSDDVLMQQFVTLNEKVEHNLAHWKETLTHQMEEKKHYRIEDINHIETRIEALRKLYFDDYLLIENLNKEETPEEIAGRVFGKRVFEDLVMHYTNLRQAFVLYKESGNDTGKTSLDNHINHVITLLNELEDSLKKSAEKAAEFKKINELMLNYANASLITSYCVLLSNYALLKNEITPRSWWQRIIVLLGIPSYTDRAFSHVARQVSVLAVMLSGDEHANITAESLAKLNDLQVLNERLKAVSERIGVLQSFWFPPRNKMAIFSDARRKLEEQIVKVILKNKVKAVCDARNIIDRNALVERLTDDIDEVMRKRSFKSISSVMATHLPEANQMLQMFKDIWNSIFCMKQGRVEKTMQPLQHVHSEVVITQFVSPALLLSRVQAEASHNPAKCAASWQ